MKVVPTDHNQTNNLTRLIICFSKQRIYIYIYIYIFFLVNVKTNITLIYFYYINPTHPLHILLPGERLVLCFCFFDGVMYTYTYKGKKISSLDQYCTNIVKILYE